MSCIAGVLSSTIGHGELFKVDKMDMDEIFARGIQLYFFVRVVIEKRIPWCLAFENFRYQSLMILNTPIYIDILYRTISPQFISHLTHAKISSCLRWMDISKETVPVLPIKRTLSKFDKL